MRQLQRAPAWRVVAGPRQREHGRSCAAGYALRLRAPATMHRELGARPTCGRARLARLALPACAARAPHAPRGRRRLAPHDTGDAWPPPPCGGWHFQPLAIARQGRRPAAGPAGWRRMCGREEGPARENAHECACFMCSSYLRALQRSLHHHACLFVDACSLAAISIALTVRRPSRHQALAWQELRTLTGPSRHGILSGADLMCKPAQSYAIRLATSSHSAPLDRRSCHHRHTRM